MKNKEQELREAACKKFDSIFEYDKHEAMMYWKNSDENKDFNLDDMVKNLVFNFAKSEYAKSYHSDAVEFAEWVAGMFKPSVIKGMWRVSGTKITYSTEQLYQQFKNK